MGSSRAAHDPSGPSGHLPIAETAMGRKKTRRRTLPGVMLFRTARILCAS